MTPPQAASRSGVALVICAPSGAGKTTLVKRLLAEFNTFAYSVSYTTRQPRTGEVDGRDYHFVSRERFEELAGQGFFAEWANVHGNLYGTPLQAIQKHLQAGHDVLFDVDVQGAKQLKAGDLPASFVFILPPSKEALRQRLEKRDTDSPDVIAQRLQNARAELDEAHWFDSLVVNDDLESAYNELRCIYVAAACHYRARKGLLQKMLENW